MSGSSPSITPMPNAAMTKNRPLPKPTVASACADRRPATAVSTMPIVACPAVLSAIGNASLIRFLSSSLTIVFESARTPERLGAVGDELHRYRDQNQPHHPLQYRNTGRAEYPLYPDRAAQNQIAGNERRDN